MAEGFRVFRRIYWRTYGSCPPAADCAGSLILGPKESSHSTFDKNWLHWSRFLSDPGRSEAPIMVGVSGGSKRGLLMQKLVVYLTRRRLNAL